MGAASFTKKAWWRKGFFNTANFQDTVVGGAITNSPGSAGTGAVVPSQYQQTNPGDRVMLGPQDAYAVSNNAVGNLFVGAYRYIQYRNNSTSNVVRGCGAFWDPTVGATLSGANISNNYTGDLQYMVTTDGNNTSYKNQLLAGVNIANISLSNGTPAYWWIQESGKATLKFIATITGTATLGAGVYLPLTPSANNNATDNGAFDQLVGANSGAAFNVNSTTGYTTVDQMIQNYVGYPEVLPSNNNLSLVDMTFQRTSFRIG